MGAGHQEDTVGPACGYFDPVQVRSRVTQLFQAQEDIGPAQEAQVHRLAQRRGQDRDAQVEALAPHAHLDAPVLRQALLGDIQTRHNLHARDDRRLVLFQKRRHRDRLQHAVDAVSDAEGVLFGLQVNVGRAEAMGFDDDLVHEPDDRSVARVLVDGVRVGVVQRERFILTRAHLLNRLGPDSVVALNRFLDMRLERKDRLDRPARHQRDLAHPLPVLRLAGGHAQPFVLI